MQDINPTFSPAAATALVGAAEMGAGQLKPEDRSACEEASPDRSYLRTLRVLIVRAGLNAGERYALLGKLDAALAALAASPEPDPVMAAAAEKYRLEIEKARGASPEPGS